MTHISTLIHTQNTIKYKNYNFKLNLDNIKWLFYVINVDDNTTRIDYIINSIDKIYTDTSIIINNNIATNNIINIKQQFEQKNNKYIISIHNTNQLLLWECISDSLYNMNGCIYIILIEK